MLKTLEDLKRQGNIEFKKNNFDQAIAIYEEGLQQISKILKCENLTNPEEYTSENIETFKLYINFNNNKCLTLIRQKQYDDALKSVNKAIRANPYNWKTKYRKAIISYYQKNYENFIIDISFTLKQSKYKYEKTPDIETDIHNKLKRVKEIINKNDEEGNQENKLYTFPLKLLYASLIDKQTIQIQADRLLTYLKTFENDYNIHYNYGLLFTHLDYTQPAIICLQKCLSISKESSYVYLLLAKALRKNNQLDKALSIIEEGIEIFNENNAELLLLKGQILFQQKQFRKSQKTYFDLIKTSPCNFVALNYLGVCFQKQNIYEQAIKYFKRSIQITAYQNDNNINSFIQLSNIELMAYHNHAAAIKVLQDCVKHNPQSADAFYNLGLIIGDHTKNIEECIKNMKQCLSIKPNHIQALYNLANLMKKENKTEKALHYYDQCLQINSNFTLGYLNRGCLQDMLGNYQEAINDYKHCASLDPGQLKAYYNMGTSYWHMGEYQKAIQSFKKCLELNPNDNICYIYIGNILQQHLKDQKKALPYFEQGVTREFNMSEDITNIKTRQHIQNKVSIKTNSIFSKQRLQYQLCALQESQIWKRLWRKEINIEISEYLVYPSKNNYFQTD